MIGERVFIGVLMGLTAATTGRASAPFGGVVPAPIARALVGGPSDRPRMLEAAMMLSVCYPENPTEERLARYIEQERALREMQGLNGRFVADDIPWVGEAQTTGLPGRAQRAHLTYSFPNDGVSWGVAPFTSVRPNNLNVVFTNRFGAANLDRGREFLRQALASWRRYAGVTYDQVADNNSAMDTENTRSSLRGDIRFGAIPLTLDGPLALNFFPLGGGDVIFNSDWFIDAAFFNSSNSYRYLRNTMAHEQGHGLGFRHVVPCSLQKLMEPFATGVFDMLQVDDRRAGGFNYGDRFSGNQSAATAVNYGNLTTPVLRSVIERNLSTNGQFGPSNSDEDWFRFTLSSPQTVSITAAPTGGLYEAGQQVVVMSLCDGPRPLIEAQFAGNLAIELRDVTGGLVLASSNIAGSGVNEVLNAGVRPAGTYTVRVFDTGPNPPEGQTVQLYDLLIRIGSAAAPPTVIAGINKRIAAAANCYFMGDISTVSNEGALTTEGFDWDLEGDGVFETLANPGPVRSYTSNGVYPITLRVTDVNGAAGTDTILLTVFGGTTRVFGCNPPSGNPGTVVPIEITGTNLKNVTLLSMVSLSGTGIGLSGTPTPNALGTSVSGVSLIIGSGAPLGPRNLTVTNSDGSGTGVNVFSVVAVPPPVPGGFGLLSPVDQSTVGSLTPTLAWDPSPNALRYDVSILTGFGITIQVYEATVFATSIDIPAGILLYDAAYDWSVAAVNDVGSTPSTPAAARFFTPPCFGDADDDRMVNFADVTEILTTWGSAYAANESGPGDANSDDVVNFADVTEVLENWGQVCP
jgi:hypothetical protein